MFNLNGFIDVSNGQPGMLVPLLSSPVTNLPYVQEMDEFLIIKEIIPFLEYENYPTIPEGQEHQERSVAIGDRGLIAFRSADGSIFCSNSEEVLKYVAENRALIQTNLALRVQLYRIEAVGLEKSYDAWRDLAKSKFADEKQRTLWLESEFRLYHKQQEIWDEIGADEFEPEKPSRPGLEKPLPEYDVEQLVRWLNIRSNYFAKGWTTVWHYVNARAPFDDRVSLIGINWMYAVNEEDADFEQSKSILYALFYRSKKSKDADWRELSEFILERVTAEPALVYSFLKPSGLLPDLLVFLATFGSVDYVLRLIKFCVENVPKEKHILVAMEGALKIIIAEQARDYEWDEPRRDFEARDHQAASTLLKEVRALHNR
jgi:hypothetical protein